MDLNDSVEMSDEAFAAVNVPVSVFSILLNMFFVFCMIFPQQGTERLKQPLKALLGSLVGCNITAHISIIVVFFRNFFLLINITIGLYIAFCVISIVMSNIIISSNCSLCLNVFYCFKIIPVRGPYFIWFKKNIRFFIYCALNFNIALSLSDISLIFAAVSLYINHITMTDWKTLSLLYQAVFWIRLSLYFFSSCVMLGSSYVMVLFLWRHMKNMEKSSGSCFSPQRQRQIRLTIRSISVQALLHITCSSLAITDELIGLLSIIKFDLKRNIFCTVISLYSFASTINLGLSQSVFRQRAVHVYHKLAVLNLHQHQPKPI